MSIFLFCMLCSLLAAHCIGCGGAEFFGLGPPELDAGAGDGAALEALDAGELAALEAGVDVGRQVAAVDAAADAQSEPAHPAMIDAGEDARAPAEPDAGEVLVEDAGPVFCQPSKCPACDVASTGYPCCTPTEACGCENPSMGGYCR